MSDPKISKTTFTITVLHPTGASAEEMLKDFISKDTQYILSISDDVVTLPVGDTITQDDLEALGMDFDDDDEYSGSAQIAFSMTEGSVTSEDICAALSDEHRLLVEQTWIFKQDGGWVLDLSISEPSALAGVVASISRYLNAISGVSNVREV